MRLRCNRCGKELSTPIPEDTVVRAWIECPECIEVETPGLQEYLSRVILPAMREQRVVWGGWDWKGMADKVEQLAKVMP
jgi:hypothetical protein